MIYLVDDDVDDLEFLQATFERHGLTGRVAQATNGQEFMSKLRRSEIPELIVLDLNMPLKNGFEVLMELKKSRNYSTIPVVILTASHNQQDKERCIDLGCNLFLRKPSTLKGYDDIVMAIFDFLPDLKGNRSSVIGKLEG